MTLEHVAVACGLANIYLTVRQNIWCWPVGVVMVSLYIYIFYNAKLYSDTGLQVFFLVMQFYGWYTGRAGRSSTRARCRRSAAWPARLDLDVRRRPRRHRRRSAA